MSKFDELIALGVFDPDAPDAEGRRALIAYLLELGASVDDLVQYRDELPVAASMIMTRPEGARLTLRDVARRTDTDVESVVRLWGLLGLPPASPDDAVAYESTVELFQIFLLARALLGDAANAQLARILGEMMTRLADAVTSAFIVAVGAPASDRDPTQLALAQGNARAGELMPPFMRAIEVLLRHHLEVGRRMDPTVGYRGELAAYEARQLAIGFADLTASTAFASRVDFSDLADALEAFEQLAADVVYRHGGRLVKLIGDEVMFSAPNALAACAIACDLVDAVAARPALPSIRVGLALGDVLVRSGDCFGPTVNLAARLVTHAGPGEVLAAQAVLDTLDPSSFEIDGITSVAPRGLDAPVTVGRVARASA